MMILITVHKGDDFDHFICMDDFEEAVHKGDDFDQFIRMMTLKQFIKVMTLITVHKSDDFDHSS